MDFERLKKEISKINEGPSETEKYLKETALPILKFAIPYLIVVYIYLWIYDNYGLGKLIVTLGVAFLFTLRSLVKVVNQCHQN